MRASRPLAELTLAPGAGHGDEGDASFQGPAQEKDQAQIERFLHSPSRPIKPTNLTSLRTSEDAPSSVIALAAVTAKLKAAEVTAVPRGGDGQVTVRAKPEKRKNAKERAKERARAKGKLGAAEEAAVTPEVTSPETAGLSTAHPKPEKRKNAKERAKEKYAARIGPRRIRRQRRHPRWRRRRPKPKRARRPAKLRRLAA